MVTNKIITRNAVLISLGIILYFFVMKWLGLEKHTWLRFLNFIFVFWGINNAIKTNMNENHETLYVRNFAVGIGTSTLAVGIVVASLIAYTNLIDPNIIQIFQDTFLWSGELTLPLIVFALLIEGVASSVVSSFMLMQYYKNYKPIGS